MTEKKKRFILIDPGHGGADPGAVAAGVTEAQINLRVAQALAMRLRGKDIWVELTQWTSKTVSLARRSDYANALMPDLLISLHCNGSENPQASGMEVWTSPGDTAADPIATEIFLSLSRAFPERKMRTDYTDGDPDKEERFHVLTRTRCPAVLIEMGFVTNPEERGWLDPVENPMAAEELATAICDGVMTSIYTPEEKGPFGMPVSTVNGRDGLD